ncbi:hypothetical protein BESB_001400 [Besnoitia besnoiti]|uniref:Transmembrane protein n=1 Tax=Besnoitia besnoiti TaxID=94643 RepID=A0A2A9MGZ4_BESBE|nr:hypothetical protein BESB_001400 [Besnoitia besnoiti]PFH37798.1 hypothetical protein BESB_001400 [Besnoitia besnoiti]
MEAKAWAPARVQWTPRARAHVSLSACAAPRRSSRTATRASPRRESDSDSSAVRVSFPVVPSAQRRRRERRAGSAVSVRRRFSLVLSLCCLLPLSLLGVASSSSSLASESPRDEASRGAGARLRSDPPEASSPASLPSARAPAAAAGSDDGAGTARRSRSDDAETGAEQLDEVSARLAGKALRLHPHPDRKASSAGSSVLAGTQGQLLADAICRRVQEGNFEQVSLGAGTTGVFERLPDERKKSHWLQVPLTETHLPGLASPSTPAGGAPELTVLVTPHRPTQLPNVQLIYQPAHGVPCAWLRDATAAGPVLLRLPRDELETLSRREVSAVTVLVSCDTPCAPLISLDWQVPSSQENIQVECKKAPEGSEVICPTLSGEALAGVPVHYEFKCTDACQEALRGAVGARIQVCLLFCLHLRGAGRLPSRPPARACERRHFVSCPPASGGASLAPVVGSAAPDTRLELLAAWGCVPESGASPEALGEEEAFRSESPSATTPGSAAKEAGQTEGAAKPRAGDGASKASVCSPLTSVGGAAGVTYLTAAIPPASGGEIPSLHLVVLSPSLRSRSFRVAFELPQSVTEIAFDRPLHVVLPPDSLRFFAFELPETMWDISASCAHNYLGAKVEFLPVEIVVASEAGGLPTLAVANEELEPRPDPAKTKREQMYAWRSSDGHESESGVPYAWVLLGSDALRARKPYGRFIVGVRASSFSLVSLAVSSRSATMGVRDWPELLTSGVGLTLNFVPFSRYCKDEFLIFRTGGDVGRSASETALASAEAAAAGRGGGDPGGVLVFLAQKQKGDMPAEFCFVPCGPTEGLFHLCPNMPVDNDAPCPSSLVTKPAADARLVRFAIPAEQLQPRTVYAVRIRLASWQEGTVVVGVWKPTPGDYLMLGIRAFNGVPFRGFLHNDSSRASMLELTFTVDRNTLPRLTTSDGRYVFRLSLLGSAAGFVVTVAIPGEKMKTRRTVSVPGAQASNRVDFSEFVASSAVWKDGEGIGQWIIRIRSLAQTPVAVDVTVSFGPEDEAAALAAKATAAASGSPRAEAQGFLNPEKVMTDTTHLMDGAVYVGRVGSDPQAKGGRRYFYFSMDYSLVAAHSLEPRPHLRCIASSFDGSRRRVRLFANVLTKANAGSYRPPDPAAPETVTWPPQRDGVFPAEEVLEVPADDPNAVARGTHSAAYVILVEGAPSVSSSASSGSTSPSTPSPSPSAPPAGDADEAQSIPFTIVCTGSSDTLPLPLGVPVERTIAADASHFYSFATPVYEKDIVISLTTGAVGDADLFVSPRREVSASAPGHLWSSAELGSDWVLLAAESKTFRSFCNEAVVSASGFCIFFILVRAQEDSQYTLEVRQESGGIDAVVASVPVNDFVRRGHSKMYSYLEVSPDEDLKISAKSDRDITLYAALGSVDLVTDLTPLHLGTAQWWSDGIATRAIEIKGADLQRRQAVLGCTFSPKDDATGAGNTRAPAKAAGIPGSSASEESPTAAAASSPDGTSEEPRAESRQCVLRIDVSAHQDQPFSLVLLRSQTNSIVTNILVDSTPNAGVLWDQVDVKYELQIDSFIVEKDLDAELQLEISSFDCHPTLTVRWPDGFVRAFEWPQSRELVIGREIHPWTPGPFIFMLHDPSIGGRTCMYVFHAHVATTLHERHPVTQLEFNVPLRASVTSHRPSFFVWTAPYHAKFEDQFYILKVTPFVHMVDVYVQPLHKNSGFMKRPVPGETLPPYVKQLVNETPESPSLVLRIGSVWRHVESVDWLPACEPEDLSTGRWDDEQLGTDTADVFHPLDSCQILISVFDHRPPSSDLSESREVDFSIHITSRLADPFEVYSFGETLQLTKEDFTGENHTKALLLYQDNQSADIHLQVRCQDPYLLSKMTAALFHNLTRLHTELQHRDGCRDVDDGRFCWVGEPVIDWQNGSTSEIFIQAEEKVLRPHGFLYVVLYLNETYSPAFQPSIEFFATQSGMYVPLKNNIDSGIYSVTADKPAFFSFEVTEPSGQVILILDPDREPPKGESDPHTTYKQHVQQPLQATSMFVQSCNTETFVRGLWSKGLLPSALLHSHEGFVNERDQLVAIVNNNWYMLNSSLCFYRIGIYTKSTEPFYFRISAALIHRSVPVAFPVNSAVLAHVSKRPQVNRNSGAVSTMAVDDKFAFRLWKAPQFDGRLVAMFEVCSGAATLRWNDRLSMIAGNGMVPGIFLSSMKHVSRRTDAATLQQQGRMYRVVKAQEANFLGVSCDNPEENRSEGYVRHNNATFSILMTDLNSASCYSAESEDVDAEIAPAPWYEKLLHPVSANKWNLNVRWKPLMRCTADAALSSDGKWTCSRRAFRESGKRVSEEEIQYEVFVAPSNATRANWLASCGLYMDAEYYKTTSKYSVEPGRTSFTLPLHDQGSQVYKVAVMAKHIPQAFEQRAQPFTYRFVEVELRKTGDVLTVGSTYLILVALVVVVFLCRRHMVDRAKGVWQELLGWIPAVLGRPARYQSRGPRGIEMPPVLHGYMPPPSTLGCSAVRHDYEDDGLSEDPFTLKTDDYSLPPLPQSLKPWSGRPGQ